MPYYDVTAHCQALARFGGAPSQLVLQGCYQQEQGAYDALKVQWEQLPAGMQQHCDGLARFAGPGSYLILQGCVTQEISAGRSNQDFQFRR